MAKLPAIQFYPGDWRKDVGVQSLSFHDRGVWFEILMLMHESERRGVLTLNGNPMPEESLARLLGLDKQILTTTLSTLITSGIASREQETGALVCRRMVRDEELRKVRSDAGFKGGNPVLLKQNPTTGVKQTPTPSSSSSSSSSKQEPPKVFVPTLSDQADMATNKVMQEAPLSGMQVRMAVEQAARFEISNGIDPILVADTMLDAWREFSAAKSKLTYAWGAEKFFGEGNWKNRAGWSWKDGCAPAPVLSGPDALAKVRAQEEEARRQLGT